MKSILGIRHTYWSICTLAAQMCLEKCASLRIEQRSSRWEWIAPTRSRKTPARIWNIEIFIESKTKRFQWKKKEAYTPTGIIIRTLRLGVHWFPSSICSQKVCVSNFPPLSKGVPFIQCIQIKLIYWGSKKQNSGFGQNSIHTKLVKEERTPTPTKVWSTWTMLHALSLPMSKNENTRPRMMRATHIIPQ